MSRAVYYLIYIFYNYIGLAADQVYIVFALFTNYSTYFIAPPHTHRVQLHIQIMCIYLPIYSTCCSPANLWLNITISSYQLYLLWATNSSFAAGWRGGGGVGAGVIRLNFGKPYLSSNNIGNTGGTISCQFMSQANTQKLLPFWHRNNYANVESGAYANTQSRSKVCIL